MSGKVHNRSVDAVLAALAARQHCVVSRRQLLELGLRHWVIDWRLEVGRLHLIRRGVYAVGHPRLTRHGLWMAAVLGAGRGAVLSHHSAAALWAIAQSDRLEVTIAPGRRAAPGLTVHRSALPADETTVVDGIPVTSVARTLLDLAAVVRPDRLASAVHEAEVRRLHSDTSLHALLARHPRRPGSNLLKELLADRALGSRVARSELEARFDAFVARHDLPPPLHNLRIEGHECDAVWPDHRLIVELDGHATHATTTQFEHDRLRDRRLQSAGWRVFRVTWRQLHQGESDLLRDLSPLRPVRARSGGSSFRRTTAKLGAR